MRIRRILHRLEGRGDDGRTEEREAWREERDSMILGGRWQDGGMQVGEGRGQRVQRNIG